MDGERRELEFLRTLGAGGFGAVYLANLHGRDRFVRRVAVKVLREGLDATPDLVARQKDEARLLGLLAHDGIVQVLDLTEVNGRPAVVMEYVEGVDVAEVIKRLGTRRVPLRGVLEIVAAVAGALDAAFNSLSPLSGLPLRVVHRDIKPANMLLTVHGRVKVLDFGVAKADFARDGHTTQGGWGTPRFMAPELWLGEPYGSPVDVYALGVSLYDLVAPRPWERPPLARTPFEHHVGRQLDLPDVPDDVLALIAGMTSFEPGDRPTATEVRERAEVLLAAAPGEPLSQFARAVVPALIEARARENANQPVPGPVSLGGVSQSGAVAPEPSMVPEPDPGSGARIAGLLVGIVAVGLLGVGALGAAWWVATRPAPVVASTAEPVTAPQETPPAASPAPAPPPQVVPVPPSEVATATETAAVAPPPGGSPAHPASSDTTRARTRRSAPSEPAAASVAPATTTGAAAAAPRAEAATLTFSVTTVPMGASVWVDGKDMGKTPQPRLALTPGPHRFEVALGDARSPATEVRVEAGGATGVRYTFDDQKWSVRK